MRTLSAKDSERVGAGEGVGLAARPGEGAGAANGLLLLLVEEAPEEKGFALAETLPVRVEEPNRLAPRSGFGAAGFFSSSSFFSPFEGAGFCSSFWRGGWCWGSIFSFLTARRARILPGLRLQALRGQEKM